MVASTHLTTGAAIGTAAAVYLSDFQWLIGVGRAFIFGVVSHFLLDMIPHSEKGLYSECGYRFLLVLFAEIAISLLLIFYLGIFWAYEDVTNYMILAGVVGSALPDAPHVFIGAFKIHWGWLDRFEKINNLFHSRRHNFSVGFFSQLLISFSALLYVFLVRYDPIH